MRVILFGFSALSVLGALAVFGNSASAIHELVGIGLLLIGAVCFGSMCIVDAVVGVRKALERALGDE